ncbi:glycosyltransferase family 4 protein [Arenibacter sp. F20364]|uniref:glycosyltransferase family 4 protein n=1 Tax=Arenibacter sp. F20364 TaxID=2926415 RepID=UPI001FF6D920|nr:glycosyltransferase family 4 protein [Arenibacter sp. F20364]MCK0192662.1 glycosyltransferase family 4 protein [Arenibacter sp. F20364]
MKILFLTDNFPPEVNAPATRTYEHCVEWVKQGAEVTVITCAPNFPKGKVYPGYKNKLVQTEIIDGIKVVRVWSYIAANEGFIKRTVDYISFSVSAFIAGIFENTDLIVATSPQFFTALSGRSLSFWKRRPWVMEVRDLWPESIKTVGAMKDNLFIRYFERQEKRCYKSAKKIISVTDSFKREIIGKGITAVKIEVVKNGANLALFQPMEPDQDLIESLNLKGKIILGYVGTHGMAHKLDFLMDCAKNLMHTNYHFLFIGSGAEREKLIHKKRTENISNVTLLDSVSKSEIKRYLSILDVSLINLKKDELFKTVIPSKIFENSAMQIPILLGVDGESRAILEKYKAGLFYEPENEKDFLDKLEKILQKDHKETYKKGGRQLALDFDRKKLAANMLTHLRGAI